MIHVARRLLEGASPRLIALVGVLATAVLAAQGALVYIAVDQVERADIAEFARRLAPGDTGSAIGPPLRLDARPTPAAVASAPGLDSVARLAEAPAVDVPGEVELILTSGPAPSAGSPSLTQPVGPVPTPGSPVGGGPAEPAPSEVGPSDDRAEPPPADPTRLANPEEDDDQREELGSSEPAPRQVPPGQADAGPRDGAPDDRPGNRCDDERVDHHDHGDQHGVDCDEPEREYRPRGSRAAADADRDHGNANLRGTDAQDRGQPDDPPRDEGPDDRGRDGDASDADRDERRGRDEGGDRRGDGSDGDRAGGGKKK